MLSGKSILITGGTGSFGNTFVPILDTSKPEGAMRKLMAVWRIKLPSWKCKTQSRESLLAAIGINRA